MVFFYFFFIFFVILSWFSDVSDLNFSCLFPPALKGQCKCLPLPPTEDTFIECPVAPAATLQNSVTFYFCVAMQESGVIYVLCTAGPAVNKFDPSAIIAFFH